METAIDSESIFSIESLSLRCHHRTANEKAQEFHTTGFCILDNVLDTISLETFRDKAMANFNEVLSMVSLGIGIKHGYKEIVQRHERRYEMPYKMIEIGALEYSKLPLIKELVTNILGPDHHVVNVSLVVSDAGAGDQSWHSDGPHVSIGEYLPCHCMNIFIPLVDVDLENGPTSFRPGSQYLTIDLQKKFLAAFLKKTLKPIATPVLKMGSILLFDYRILHRGTANKTELPRPILVLTFGKSWYKDNLNFPTNSVFDASS